MKSITYGIVLQEKTVKAFEPGSIVEVSVDGVGKAIRECVDEIESLRQQLDAAEANCQCELIKLEQQLADATEVANLSDGMYRSAIRQLAEKDAGLEAATQIINQYASELDLAISQAKREGVREALLEAINEWEKPYGLTDGSPFIERLRRMADNLKD